MKLVHKRSCQVVWALFLSLFIFLADTAVAVNNCLAYENVVFLNDRSADIIGSASLLVPGFLTPSGLSGKGQIIGIADSGLDKGSISDIHPDLQSEPGAMPRVAMLKSYSGRTVPDDPNGHGTHMAATIVGSGQASDDGKYQGIAPGASLYFQALLDEQGQLRTPSSIDDLFSPAYEAGVRIHVNGWGSSGNDYTGSSAQIDNYVNLHPDFLPVFGAGNSGPEVATITTEANSKNALVIGSSQVPRPVFSNEARYADQPAASSSRGPAQDGRIKPELLAPGSAVISACSSLTTGNFKPNSQYTLMGGSSMAAAVAGGSLVLLREYLNTHEGINNPSSALLKALMINGARDAKGGSSSRQGFGILDLLGTVLALQEARFNLVEEVTGVHTGESREYKIHLDGKSAPFKATLAWVDPPAGNGTGPALVNNLDLIVRDPQGKLYYGNDFLNTGYSDSVNNVEQVTIPQTITGEYTIFIKGANLNTVYPKQTYALVYGMPLKHEIVRSADSDGKISLASSGGIDLTTYKTINEVNGQQYSKFEQIAAGTDVYISEKTAYFVSRNREIEGVQALSDGSGPMLMEINAGVRDGGFFIDSQVLADEQLRFWLNEQSLTEVSEIPAGSRVIAAVNPGLQTIWQLKAEYDQVQGFIENLNPEKREIKLAQDRNTYLIAKGAAISYNDQLLECDDLDAPYGSAETASLAKLAPGMKVSLVLSPSNKQVQYIKVTRDIVIGEVHEVNASGEQLLTLDSGKNYKIFPGAQLFKDGEEVGFSDIKPGVKVSALLLPGTSNIIQLQAISNVAYGKVVYYNTKSKTLFVFNQDNQFKTYELNPAAQVFKKGLQVDAPSIESGKWVRLILNPAGTSVWRVDIAEANPANIKIFSGHNPLQMTLSMADNTTYQYNSSTLFSKGGYKISPDLILPGERLIISALDSIYPGTPCLAQVEVVSNPGIKTPDIKAEAYSLNGVLIIKGNSNADRVFLNRSDGSRNNIAVNNDGSFSVIYKMQENENKVQILAMDLPEGGIKGIDLKICDFPVPQSENNFTDISGNPAEQDIINLGKKGIVSGYGDGTFRPEQWLSRAEFISILARAKNWDIEASTTEPQYFKDNDQIPWWAVGAVYAARKLEIINGYPDGSFHPSAPITKGEVALIMKYRVPGNKTDPVTRGEAAVLINQAMQ